MNKNGDKEQLCQNPLLALIQYEEHPLTKIENLRSSMNSITSLEKL